MAAPAERRIVTENRLLPGGDLRSSIVTEATARLPLIVLSTGEDVPPGTADNTVIVRVAPE